MLTKLRCMVMKGVVMLVNNSLKMQGVQVQALAGLTSEMERYETFGHTSAPLAGAEAIILNVGATQGNSVVICVADRRYRLQGLAGGDAALYDAAGNYVWLHADGTTEVKGVTQVLVNSPKVLLGGAGGQSVARVGDSVDPSTFKITSGSAAVSAL